LSDILIGLLLGDLNANKARTNTRLSFKQGAIHKEYVSHLYELFKGYCSTPPKMTNQAADLRTGKVYVGVYFNTIVLPCFNYYYDLFYPAGIKIVPENIGDLLTPLGCKK
jgi:hypothetical protein